ncbi:MAG: L-aspartate oxidase, partial [Pirellulales bacterium]
SLKSLMWHAAGVRRDAASLTEAEEMVGQWSGYVLNRQFNDPAGWQLQNMLWIARLMISAAHLREESRGVHLRVDYPALDNAHWQKHLAFVRGSAP